MGVPRRQSRHRIGAPLTVTVALRCPRRLVWVFEQWWSKRVCPALRAGRRSAAQERLCVVPG